MKMARSLSGSSVSHVTANSIYDCFILRAQWLVPSMTARKFDITKPALGAFVLLYCGLTLYLNVLGAQLLIARMYLRSGGGSNDRPLSWPKEWSAGVPSLATRSTLSGRFRKPFTTQLIPAENHGNVRGGYDIVSSLTVDHTRNVRLSIALT